MGDIHSERTWDALYDLQDDISAIIQDLPAAAGLDRPIDKIDEHLTKAISMYESGRIGDAIFHLNDVDEALNTLKAEMVKQDIAGATDVQDIQRSLGNLHDTMDRERDKTSHCARCGCRLDGPTPSSHRRSPRRLFRRR